MTNKNTIAELLTRLNATLEELAHTQATLTSVREQLSQEVVRNTELYSDKRELELAIQRVQREVNRLKQDNEALEEELSELKALIPRYDEQ